jgi:hypothetical protein
METAAHFGSREEREKAAIEALRRALAPAMAAAAITLITCIYAEGRGRDAGFILAFH